MKLIGVASFWLLAYAVYPNGVFSIPFAQLTLGYALRLFIAVIFVVGGLRALADKES